MPRDLKAEFERDEEHDERLTYAYREAGERSPDFIGQLSIVRSCLNLGYDEEPPSMITVTIKGDDDER